MPEIKSFPDSNEKTEVPAKTEPEGILDYACKLAQWYASHFDITARKSKGQIFTPKPVGAFMVNLFDLHQDVIRFLDPGAGTGILTAALCERILKLNRTVTLTIDAYENDPLIQPLLFRVLAECQSALEKKGHRLTYHLHPKDFVLSNAPDFNLSARPLLWDNPSRPTYDYVISNPPYYKLNKNSSHSAAMMELVKGQPNVYPFFMALSADMTAHQGEMVFISPRSFCSGLYYEKFREWFLGQVQITHIHIFESRKEIFDADEVLQENIIVKARKIKAPKPSSLKISVSENKHLQKIKTFDARFSDVFYRPNRVTFIRVPTSPLDVEMIRLIDRWPHTLGDFGWEISTGPVIPFRSREFLLPQITLSPEGRGQGPLHSGRAIAAEKGHEKSRHFGVEAAPLLWMHNLRGLSVIWPLDTGKKAVAVRVCDETAPILLPVKNYVLVKRFSSKEQKRRLYASVLLAHQFPYENVGIENHVNYIHKPRGILSVNEAYGIVAMLSTRWIDNFFRSLNGNTQVNATDLRNLPFPPKDRIEAIGQVVKQSQDHADLDKIVADALGLKPGIVENLALRQQKATTPSRRIGGEQS